MARRGAKSVMSTGVAALKVSADGLKYTGHEDEFVGVELTEKNRRSLMLRSFNWYNYHFNSKDAGEMVFEYLNHHKKVKEAKLFKKNGIGRLPNAIAWLCRMSMVGWQLNEEEQASIDHAIKLASESPAEAEKPKDDTAEKPSNSTKPNVQEIMRDKALELAGELEHLLDEYIKEGAKKAHKIEPIKLMRATTVLPQHIPMIIEFWEKHKAEFTEAHAGKCSDLSEAYSHFTKIQLRNLIAFADLMLSDLESYIAYKKATKAKPKRRTKTPQQQVAKLKYLKEFPELNLKSLPPTKILECKELFVYSTRKRKLQYYIADEHAGNAIMVKNSSIVGFDLTKSAQKTIRKPEEAIKQFMGASKPQSRKLFKDIKTVETKLTGRFADDLVILKAW